jgi:hypothetical protein
MMYGKTIRIRGTGRLVPCAADSGLGGLELSCKRKE